MMNTPEISLIVAIDAKGGIGCSQGLPWHIPGELKYFKEKTLNKPVIMGRKTYEFIIEQFGRPLPKRENIVVSRSGYKNEFCVTYPNLEDSVEYAKRYAEKTGQNEIFIIGGAEIFKQSLDFADTVYRTKINDTFRKANAFLEDSHFRKWTTVFSHEEVLREKIFDKDVLCE